MVLKNLVKIIIFQFILIIFSILLLNKVDATIANKLHTRLFTVEDEFIKVTESKKTTVITNGFQVPAGSPEGFTIFNPVMGDPDAEAKLKMTLDSIDVRDDTGKKLEFKIDKTESNNYIIKVPHSRSIGFNESSELFLTYKSYGLVILTGAVRDIYIPGFPKDYSFETDKVSENVITKVKIPDSLGEINFTSPKQDIKNGEINVSKEDLIGNSIWIQIGNEQYFEFTINQKIPKTNDFPFVTNTFSMPIPRDIQSGPIKQEVFYTQIEPNPYTIKLDHDGNLLAYFKTSAAKEGSVLIKGYSKLTQDKNFDFKDAGTVDDIPENFKRYLAPSEFWEVDNAKIRETSLNITNSKDVYEIIQATYDYVIGQIDYSFVKKYGLNERKGALATLNGGAAVCMEYSDLFITLLRAQGVPARAAFGFGYGAADYESRSENQINHQWAEVYLPKLDTWINVDTTWGYFGNNLIGGDLNHFYSHVSSINPETPSTSELTYFGKLQNIPEREMQIFILPEISKDKGLAQSEILNKYSEPEGISQTYYNLQVNFNIFNNLIDDFFKYYLSINTSSISFSLKLLLLFLSFIAIITSILMLQKALKQKK